MFGKFARISAFAALIASGFATEAAATGLGGLVRNSGIQIRDTMLVEGERASSNDAPIAFCKGDLVDMAEFARL